MRIVIAILCVFSLVLVACGDDDEGEASLETFCEKNAELDELNARLFMPPLDETPEEVEALATEALVVVGEMEAAAPEEIQEAMNQLIPFEDFNDVLEQNGWDVEASGDEIDAMIAGVDSDAVAEWMTFIDENCTTDTASTDG